MLSFNREKVKSAVLIVLVLSSIIQVGILWDYQSHRFPFNFISKVFSSQSNNDKTDIVEIARKDIFSPYRITISNGNRTHWVIGKDDYIYNELWDEACGYLEKVLTSGEGHSVNMNTWIDLTVKKSIMIEFKTGIKTGLLKWFLDITGSSSDYFDSIQKIFILPYEDINNNNTVYIYSSKGLYRYIVPFNKKGMLKSGYTKTINNLEYNGNIVQYNTFKEIDPNNVISKKLQLSISPDILCVAEGIKYYKYPSAIYYDNRKTADIEEIARVILGNEKESFDRYIENNAVVFKNINNTYRLYNDGLLEYKYIPGVDDQEKSDIGSAFEKAYIFISRIKKGYIDPETDLYLKQVKDENQGYYEFIFDYKLGDLPVYINFQDKSGDKEPVKSAVSIKANGKRIIECRWYLASIEKSRTQSEYNIYFEDMLNEMSKKYGKQSFDNIEVKDITMAYLLNGGYDSKGIPPVWIIERSDGEYYFLQLAKKNSAVQQKDE
ncbi:MAG TPA: hypothetical protein PK733_06735 [Clostridiales bacterium]|nr:hypothetical protein [Clostridiales bacterium]